MSLAPMTLVLPSLDRELPHSDHDERAFLGAIIINNNVFFRAPLSADDFHRPQNRLIYAAMALLVEEGSPIDLNTLCAMLKRQGVLTEAGNYAGISGLTDVVPDVANAEAYAAEIARMAKKRRGVLAGFKLAEDSFAVDTEPEDVAAAAMASLSAQTTREDAQARPLCEVLGETYDAMESLRARNASVSLACGWNTLDTHKIFSPTFAVTGAPTKHGKSAWMMAIARDLASNGNPVAIFSLESSNRELALRHTSAVTGIPHSRTRDWRTFSDRDFERVAECRRITAQMPIYLTRGLRTAEEIALEIRRLKMLHGLKAAFIDYIQLVDLQRRVDNREERLAEVAKLFLEVAIEDVHVHALSQLRDGAGEDGKHLGVADLAYAKAIGKSARIVMGFLRPHVSNAAGASKPCQVDFAIIGNNEERTNDFTAHFDEVTQAFSEGTCEQNDCRSLRGMATERKLWI